MIQKFTLYKTQKGFIVTSDEVPKDGELILPDSRIIATYREMYKGDEPLKCWLKVIAQQEQIDFSLLKEEEQKKIGWFDVEKLSFAKYEYCMSDIYLIKDEVRNYTNGFKQGFQKAQELLSDRIFTIEDIRLAFNNGYSQFTARNMDSEDYIELLTKTSWEVEIEMEDIDVDYAWNLCRDDTTRQFHFHHYDSGMKTIKKEFKHLYQQPKFINGMIRIKHILCENMQKKN
jgi:hypothetical protein